MLGDLTSNGLGHTFLEPLEVGVDGEQDGLTASGQSVQIALVPHPILSAAFQQPLDENLLVVRNGVQEYPCSFKALRTLTMLLGACRCMPVELPRISSF